MYGVGSNVESHNAVVLVIDKMLCVAYVCVYVHSICLSVCGHECIVEYNVANISNF